LALQPRHLEVGDFEASLLNHVNDFANMYVGIWFDQEERLLQVLPTSFL